MKIIVASDSFKGTFSSLEIAEKVKETIGDIATVVPVAISDGGEGFCEAVTQAMKGEYHFVDVHDPLMRPIRAKFGVINKDTAIIEIAQASGLTLLKKEEYDPWNATTYGTGELISAALNQGFRKMIIGLGGSATNDCGKGMLEAIADRKELEECEIIIASDVTNPLCGENGAAHVFARQKGADTKMIEKLDKRNLEYGKMLEKQYQKPIISQSGSGAAGGLGAALLTMKKVKMESGINMLLDLQHFDKLLIDANAVITGEGCIDPQTLCGKAPYGIALRSQKANVPCFALYGLLKLSSEQISHSPWTKLIDIKQILKLREICKFLP